MNIPTAKEVAKFLGTISTREQNNIFNEKYRVTLTNWKEANIPLYQKRLVNELYATSKAKLIIPSRNIEVENGISLLWRDIKHMLQINIVNIFLEQGYIVYQTIDKNNQYIIEIEV